MIRLLLALCVALVCAAPASSAPRSLRPTIAPNVGMGGVTLGMSRTAYDRVVGTLPENAINWWNVITDATGRVVYLQTFSNWSVPGTGFVNQRPQNLAALKRAYGSRLHGPYMEGGDFLDNPTVFYELKGTLHGVPVHTIFDLEVDDPSLNMVVDTTVAYCSGPPTTVIGCGPHKAAVGY